MMHWACRYIGKPWVAGATGPDAFDCWGLAAEVQRIHYGRMLPQIGAIDASDVRAVSARIATAELYDGWVEISQSARKDGDMAFMAHNRFASHVGVWLDVDGGGILHCSVGQGVIFSRPEALKLAGWGRMSFWRPYKCQ